MAERIAYSQQLLKVSNVCSWTCAKTLTSVVDCVVVNDALSIFICMGMNTMHELMCMHYNVMLIQASVYLADVSSVAKNFQDGVRKVCVIVSK